MISNHDVKLVGKRPLTGCYFQQWLHCPPNCSLVLENCKKSCGICSGENRVGEYNNGGRPSGHGKRRPGDVGHGDVYPWGRWVSTIQNSKDCGWPRFQTPRGGLKIQRAAEYFWRASRCLEIWPNSVLSVWYIFSTATKTRDKREIWYHKNLAN